MKFAFGVSKNVEEKIAVFYILPTIPQRSWLDLSELKDFRAVVVLAHCQPDSKQFFRSDRNDSFRLLNFGQIPVTLHILFLLFKPCKVDFSK